MTGRVVVVGSCNHDIVVSGGAIPRPGETVAAPRLDIYAGGKGLNQAIAAARAGASVTMIGAVGDDREGSMLRSTLVDAQIDVSLVRTVRGHSGTAVVAVDQRGENAISIIAGANARFGELSEMDRDSVRSADVLMLQLEMPMQVVVEAAAVAATADTRVILTPAPVTSLPATLIAHTDLILANRGEASQLTGAGSAERACELLARDVDDIVVTVGADGVWYRSGGRGGHIAAAEVTALDTTAAGDAFAGYVGAATAEGVGLVDAIGRATLAAAICVTRRGSSNSIPTWGEVDQSFPLS